MTDNNLIKNMSQEKLEVRPEGENKDSAQFLLHDLRKRAKKQIEGQGTEALRVEFKYPNYVYLVVEHTLRALTVDRSLVLDEDKKYLLRDAVRALAIDLGDNKITDSTMILGAVQMAQFVNGLDKKNE